VGKVDCFEIPGRKVWFNSNDHLPPHFHVENEDDWESWSGSDVLGTR
jgi:hypothetical protein